MFHRALRCGVTAAAVLAVGLAGVTPAQAAAGEGAAYGLKADGQLIVPIIIAPQALSKTLPEGPETSQLLDPGLPAGITVGAMNTSAHHDPFTGDVTSQATAAGVEIPGNLIGSDVGVGIDSVQAQCSSTQAGTSGTTNVSGLKVPGGQSIPDGAVNYSFDVGRGRMTVNEQIQNPDGGLTVNAAHLTIPGFLGESGVDIVIASATCGPATTPAD
ncbi:choice-of-anchor P family protein [Streptomyces goshikiensis]|uniref:choice-of-anchor P family protein n=1 Tax=Streptomyces goshikiensis TaxID=1942 RepID=UPI003720327A